MPKPKRPLPATHLRECFDAFASRPFFEAALGAAFSFAEAGTRANSIASYLADGPKEDVVLASRRRWEWVITDFACTLAGKCSVPLAVPEAGFWSELARQKKSTVVRVLVKALSRCSYAVCDVQGGIFIAEALTIARVSACRILQDGSEARRESILLTHLPFAICHFSFFLFSIPSDFPTLAGDEGSHPVGLALRADERDGELRGDRVRRQAEGARVLCGGLRPDRQT
mmetsp:Transcript_4137/g.16013  ORF Transcript_4137/g.16013 Transcript_4137/m.16013 type:complete len:228 (-) Transcript_4137:103-786(-)